MPRHLGMQLKPICLTNWKSVLNLLINLVINLWCLYFIIQMDVQRFDAMAQMIQTIKPFFALIIRIFLGSLQALAFFFLMSYYFLYGSQIIDLLDNKYFYRIYHSKRQAKRFLAIGIIHNTIYFFIIHFDHIYYLIIEKITIVSVLEIMCIYVLNAMYIFQIVILMYEQNATKKTLERIFSELTSQIYDNGKTIYIIMI